MAEADRPAVRGFLLARRDMAMFLPSGLEGRAPRPVRLWLAEARAAGARRAVLAASGEAAELACGAVGVRPVDRAGSVELPAPVALGAPHG